MFGKVDEAGPLWAAADLVVAKPLVYVEQRAIALRLPYVHLLPSDEHERETARIYVDRGIGRSVDHVCFIHGDKQALRAEYRSD